MSRALLAALVACAALAPSPASAYVRSTDDQCGVCFFWPSRAVPFVVNPPGDEPDGVLEASCGGSAALDAVRLGFQAWSDPACTDLALVDAGVSTSTFVGYAQGGTNENLVVFRKGVCQDLFPPSDPCFSARDAAGTCDNVHNCFLLSTGTSRSTIALTTVTYSPADGRILDADMELYAWDGLVPGATIPSSGAPPDGWYFTCVDPASVSNARCGQYDDTACCGMDVENTVTHEAGHFIGLAHPCEQPNCGGIPGVSETTMYPAASACEVKKRSLAPDDEAGLCAIYPAGAATPTCQSSCDSSSDGGCGCGTATPAGVLGVLLGVAGLAPRLARRRRTAQATTTDA
jgi:hypothetical protein